MTAFDITPLQIPVGGPHPALGPPGLVPPAGKMQPCIMTQPAFRSKFLLIYKYSYVFILCNFFVDPVPLNPGEPQSVAAFIGEHKKRSDADPNAPPFDDLRNYAYEGGGSTAGSLSSLASGKNYYLNIKICS